ncbi:MAG: hypothetical protein EOO88_36125 [Pedobacter sp.]|nr:MAG: hypothetical protein EOO88_36125 [Pedobacter sp.]
MKNITMLAVILIGFQSCNQHGPAATKNNGIDSGHAPASQLAAADNVGNDTIRGETSPDSIENIQARIPPIETINQSLTILGESELFSIAASDDEVAFAHINWAWQNTGPCTRFILCATYIGNFEIVFSNGSIGFSRIVQRLTTSARDCIKNAKKAMLGRNGDGVNPDRDLAVAWVMASQIHNRPVYDWLRLHGDNVIRALAMIH